MGSLELVQTLSKHTGCVWNISWHPLTNTLASCGEDKTIRIWSQDGNFLNNPKWAHKVILTDGHERTIREVAWSPCGNYLASAGFDAKICIWDKKNSFDCNATLEGHENEVKSVAWSRSGHYLATCSRDRSVWVWEVMEDDEYECAAVLNAHTQDVKKVAWHPNNDTLASASYDDTIKIFREDPLDNDWICVETLSGHTSTVWGISWDSTGTRLASCSDDGTIKIWKEYSPGNQEGIEVPPGEVTWKNICSLSGYHTRTIYDICWNHTTGLIATAGGDDSIRIFKEAETSDPNAPVFEQIACAEKAHDQDVNSVAWSCQQPNLLASCSDDGNIKLWQFNEAIL